MEFRLHAYILRLFFFSEKAWLIRAKFNVEPSLEEETKVDINGPGHMTKMVKTIKNLLIQNQWSYDLVTWHAALET